MMPAYERQMWKGSSKQTTNNGAAMQTKMKRSSWVKCGKVETHALHTDVCDKTLARMIEDQQRDLYGQAPRRKVVESDSITDQGKAIKAENKRRMTELDLAVQRSRAQRKARAWAALKGAK